jgi:hypothetical protein
MVTPPQLIIAEWEVWERPAGYWFVRETQPGSMMTPTTYGPLYPEVVESLVEERKAYYREIIANSRYRLLDEVRE